MLSLLKSENKLVWQLTKVFGCHQEGLILNDCLPDSIVNQTKFDSNTRHLNVFIVFTIKVNIENF
ncbi:hypothetical protein VCRA2117O328_480001 [Vibrio crassostreae]|nr:hypothetical protein VCRA2117O328_480001 [Vibrio crassostreae]